jgi:hypothetical protein
MPYTTPLWSRTRFLLFILAMAASPLAGQTFGEITGSLSDPSGAVVAGASVTVTNVSTNQVRRVQTNEAGDYTVPFLLPGNYDIQAESAGFKTATRRGVTLQVGSVARINFLLELGDVAETIEVTGGASLLVTESTALGTVIENKRIIELPLNGRNFLQMIALSPNVVAEAGISNRIGGERGTQSFSVAGQRLEFNRYTLDGVENTDANYNTFVVRPSIEALQEFKVQTGVYSAEFGRATSQINATTKSGTNEFHGAVFEFLRNSALDAKEWRQAGAKNPFRRNQFGFTLGGPLVRNRLFFLSNFEALRDRKTLQQIASVATDRMRAGDFSATNRIIFDPDSRVFGADARGNPKAVSATRFPNQIIPQNRIQSFAGKIHEFYPAPVVPGDNTNRNYLRQDPRNISSEQFTQRIDWQEKDNSTWFGRFSWGDEFVQESSVFADTKGRVETKAYQAMLSNTRTFGPTTVNEFRFGYVQFQNDALANFATVRNIQEELAIPGLVANDPFIWGVPEITFGNANVSGLSQRDAKVGRNHTFQWLDNVSVVRGSHSFKFGGEIRRNRFNEFGNSKAAGEFQFPGQATFDPANRQATGNGYADFLLGWLGESARSLGAANAMFRSTDFYLYVQDDWKITPKLTMNIGLRYENNQPFHDKYRGAFNIKFFDLGIGPNGLLEKTQVPVFVRPREGDFYEGIGFRLHDPIPVVTGNEHLGLALVDHDWNNFAPRLGFAYSPTQRWTIRTGLGVFFTVDTGNPRYDLTRNGAGRGLFTSDLERLNSNITDPWAAERALFQCTGWDGPCLGPVQGLGIIPSNRTPYVWQWLFNVQRELGNDLVVEFGYQGNAGHKLEAFRTYNQPVLKTGPNDARTIAQRSPWPMYNRIQEVDANVNANYHAFSTKLTQRFSKGLTYLLGYTYSKAIDSRSAIRTNNGDNLYPRDSYDLRMERGLAQFDQRQRLVASVLYELPFTAQSGILNAIVGGWQLGSIFTFGDGTAWNVGTIGDTNAVNQLGNYPHATGISPFPDDPTPQKFWNVEAFDTTNPNLSWLSGNAGRNVLRTPGTRQWDFSLIKNFRVREGHTLQFRFEAFNFSNHPNWSTPSNNSRSAAQFGVINSARTMREMQFGLKYLF